MDCCKLSLNKPKGSQFNSRTRRKMTILLRSKATTAPPYLEALPVNISSATAEAFPLRK